MDQRFNSIIALLAVWGGVSATVAGLVKWAISFQHNKKSVRELKKEMEQFKRDLDGAKEDFDDYKERTEKAIDKLMDLIYKK